MYLMHNLTTKLLQTQAEWTLMEILLKISEVSFFSDSPLRLEERSYQSPFTMSFLKAAKINHANLDRILQD
ncbi:hypothetical protein VNO77_30960 [Canavalia gladiata]|uniref:Uncharacterized protein n=1 Tax=Canavalia gladiata TaxID=3824 RepID=A0AAN9Q4G5_CANGL